MDKLPVFIVNLPSSTVRRQKMEFRTKLAGLHNVKFVPGVLFDSKTVDKLAGKCRPWYNDVKQWRRDLGCLAGHLAAIKAFLSGEDELAMICEDDILFHKDFSRICSDLISHAGDFSLISLTYCLTDGIKQTYFYKSEEVGAPEVVWPNGRTSPQIYHGLWKIDPPQHVWFAGCYLIRRAYAAKIYYELNREVTEKITSEAIIQRSGGFLSAVPLVLEDSITSDRAPQDLPYHVKQQSRWPFANYAHGDPEKLSPLWNSKPENAYPGFPFVK